MIAVNNLSVQFTGTDLFDNVTFNIGDHDRVGLVGKNGAGKSTLLKILCGWQQPETGTAKLTIDDAAKGIINVYIPADAAGQTLHVICEASDNGPFSLKSYQRIIIKTALR